MSPCGHAVVAPLAVIGAATLAIVVAALSVTWIAMRGLFEIGQGVGQWLSNRTG